jgi:hypothetical protein
VHSAALHVRADKKYRKRAADHGVIDVRSHESAWDNRATHLTEFFGWINRIQPIGRG